MRAANRSDTVDQVRQHQRPGAGRVLPARAVVAAGRRASRRATATGGRGRGPARAATTRSSSCGTSGRLARTGGGGSEIAFASAAVRLSCWYGACPAEQVVQRRRRPSRRPSRSRAARRGSAPARRTAPCRGTRRSA